MTATAAGVVPGIYDISAEEYHADPIPGGSLSSTGARKLLPPSCPALYEYEIGDGRLIHTPKKHFDLGTAVHTLVFDDGPELVRIDHDTYRTQEAQHDRDEAYAAGAIPLLPHQRQQAEDMAAAVLNHHQAGELLTPGTGEAEQTFIWQDQATGVWCRARVDWLAPTVVDLKTTSDVSPQGIQKSVAAWGYHQQRGWYLDGIRAVLGEDRPWAFVFVANEPPYLVTVMDVDATAALIADAKNARARWKYRECVETGHWPAYDQQIWTLPLPGYAEKTDIEEYLK